MTRYLFAISLFVAAQGSMAATTSIFNGESFDGWEGDTAKTWRVEDGAITAGSLKEVAPRNEFLATTKQYKNFDLRLKFKISGNHQVNAGVQFRTQRIPNHHEVIGYQADIGTGVDGHLYDQSQRGRIGAGRIRELLTESVLWPSRQIREGFMSIRVLTDEARVYTGYRLKETDDELHLKDTSTGHVRRIAQDSIEHVVDAGSIMPRRANRQHDPRRST